MTLKPGDLMLAESCNLWDGPANTVSGIVIGHTDYGELVLVLEIFNDKDIKILSHSGVVGWIDAGHRMRLHEAR